MKRKVSRTERERLTKWSNFSSQVNWEGGGVVPLDICGCMKGESQEHGIDPVWKGPSQLMRSAQWLAWETIDPRVQGSLNGLGDV